MTPEEHYAEAERIAAAAKSLDRANQEGFTGWSRADLAALAQVYATLATGRPALGLTQHVHLPMSAARQPFTIDRAARTQAAELLEGTAIGGEGEQRQRTVDRLVANTHPDAREIAVNALACAGTGDRRLAVLAAIKTLGLDGAL